MDDRSLNSIDRIRMALAMAEAGYKTSVDLEEADALLRAYDKLCLSLKSILMWHQNWDAPFHDEPEWIGDYRLAREELGLVPPGSFASPESQNR